MTESEYIDELWALWPTEGDATDEALLLADDAVAAYPNSARLWIMRGNLILLGSGNTHAPEDVLASYEQAIKIDPTYAAAYEEIGHFWDNVMDDPERAAPYFQQADTFRNK